MAVPCLIGNSAAHPWVVQKFGGTSVGKFPDKVRCAVPSGALVTLPAAMQWRQRHLRGLNP